MRRAALIPLVALTLAGCTAGGGGTTSAGDFSGREGDVADTVAEFADAAGQGEASRACAETLSQALRDKLADGDRECADELGDAFDDAEGAGVEIDDVAIDGTRATAEVSVDDRDQQVRSTFALVDEDGDWHIDSFGTPARR